MKCDKNLFSQKDNIEKLKIAKRRFNQYVYQDEDNKYQVSLKDGKEINVSDDLFEFMKKALCLRKEKGKVELDADQSSRVYGFDPYAMYVIGDIKAMWNHFFAEPLAECVEIMDECLQYLTGVMLITIHFANGSFIREVFTFPGIGEGCPYTGPFIAVGGEFHTRLPNGLYPNPYDRYQYIAVRQGFARSLPCIGFDWHRNATPKFYSREDAILVDDFDYYHGWESR